MRKELPFRSLHLFALLFLFLLSQPAMSQLDPFALTVTNTEETCTGNGTLTFATQNTTPGATLIYSVFLLPDVTTPIAVLSGNTITGLGAGTYSVVATQTLGNLTNSQTQQIVIQNQIVPVTFTITGTPESCANGTITVTATGPAAFYETISGPTIVPPQASNVFTGMAAGTYNVRVIDECGDGHVQTFTLEGTSYLLVTPLELICPLVDCDTVSGGFTVITDPSYPDMTIVYPLYVTITVYPPDTSVPPQNLPPIVVTLTINSGTETIASAMAQIPFFPGQEYLYDIAVADSCGHTFFNNGNSIDEEFSFEFFSQPLGAPQNSLNISPCFGAAPYTVSILGPPGFDPTNHNPNHPGPLTSLPILYLSTPEHSMPDGNYIVTITDSCGNTSTGESTLTACQTAHIVRPECPKLGLVTAPGDSGAPLATAIITSAPDGFPNALPYDITFMLTETGYLSIVLPPGIYIIEGMTVCDKPYIFNVVILEPHVEAVGTNSFGCAPDTGILTVNIFDGFNLQTVVITQAPDGFPQPLPLDVSNSILPDDLVKAEISGLLSGDYVLQVTDTCGNLYVVNANVPINISNLVPYYTIFEGCEVGFGSIQIRSYNEFFAQVIIMSAPETYPNALPHDVSFNITDIGSLNMNTLPEGDYTIYTKDVCGVEHTFPMTMTGSHLSESDIQIIGNCGSFNVNLSYNPNTPAFQQFFWLQQYNPSNGSWQHPITGFPYVGETLNTDNSYILTNDAMNYNIASMGTFRIIKTNLIFSNGSRQWTVCTEVIKEFEFNGALQITSAYSIPCSNGVSQVFIIAGDTFPLRYKITQKDGQPFVVDNGTLNIFSGLESGIYNFQVEDECGNIANRLFDIVSLAEPLVSAHNLCQGQNGYLAVQALSYLSYQWWNGNSPGTILSTSSTLLFSPFSQTTTPGTYFVRIYSQSALSCIDTTISYTIPAASNPNAGQDVTATLCGSNAAVDLFSYLIAPYDANGYWQEVTSSGLLTGHNWLPVGVAQGTYVFKYTVNGFCTDSDEALVTIDFKGPAPVPVIAVNQEFCSGGDIQFNVNAIPDAVFQWSGPNNFSFDGQNLLLQNTTSANNGTYTVTATLNGCEASSSATITVNTSPDFTIEKVCNGGAYTIQAVPIANSFDPQSVIYNWTGPQNYTSSENPITITGLSAGAYGVTITNAEGCNVTKVLEVSNTRCSLQIGISPNGDGKNEVFDLTGFDVIKFKIFNRYGRMVFEQDHYTNQWHGQDFNGNELPDATYYYYIRMNSGEEKTGWVYVSK